MTPVRFAAAANAEFAAAAHFYERRQAGLGLRFIDAVEATVGRAQRTPLLHRLIEIDIRKIRVRRFPYALVYRVHDSVEILAVMHLKRRPGYWQERK